MDATIFNKSLTIDHINFQKIKQHISIPTKINTFRLAPPLCLKIHSPTNKTKNSGITLFIQIPSLSFLFQYIK